MAFKHKTDTVHYHDTAAEARECEAELFAVCEHGMSADLCDGPQHYPYDRDELAESPWAVPPAVTTMNLWNEGNCEGGKCSWYDKCHKHREQDVAHGDRWGNFRAYND